MRLDEIADVRAGDKGDSLILAVVPRLSGGYERLCADLTVDLVREHFAPLLSAAPERRLVPGVEALVFWLPGVLGGGVTGSTVLDGHGKTLSYHLLGLELPDRG